MLCFCCSRIFGRRRNELQISMHSSNDLPHTVRIPQKGIQPVLSSSSSNVVMAPKRTPCLHQLSKQAAAVRAGFLSNYYVTSGFNFIMSALFL
ncbi:Klarsicht protein [Trichinella pseudospiralis]